MSGFLSARGSTLRPRKALIAFGAFSLLSVAGVPIPFFAGGVSAVAQAPADKSLVDTWQGTLHAGKDLRTLLKITRGPDGKLAAQFYSIDQGAQPFPVSTISFNDGVLKYAITPFDLTYEGKISADGKTITGNSTQGGSSLPLNFDRTTPETAWEIPKPPPPIKPMPATAHPSFDVVTVKPSKPDEPGKMFRVEGRRFTTLNTTFGELVAFAYGIHSKQIVGAPAWISTDKFDLAGTPDQEGAPNDAQWKEMLQKMLAERFQFKFHRDTRELSAYELTVAKTGPKLEKSTGDPNGLPGLWFSQLGNLHVTNANMEDFSHLMQEAVLDRPVVDDTKLQGRWNFNLKWTPDESQFSGMGIKVPTTEAADAPPPLFTAIQDQDGLRLEATRTSVPVFVVDRLEKPSEN